MGKIIRNGIEYGGTYDSATSVNYDNSVSGLNARTVQEGIDQLNESLDWKFLTRITDAKGKSFSFPTEDWNELKIYVLVSGGTNCLLSLSILKDIVAEGVQYVSDTIYAGANNYDTAILAFTTNGITVHNLISGGVSQSGIVIVFYK